MKKALFLLCLLFIPANTGYGALSKKAKVIGFGIGAAACAVGVGICLYKHWKKPRKEYKYGAGVLACGCAALGCLAIHAGIQKESTKKHPYPSRSKTKSSDDRTAIWSDRHLNEFMINCPEYANQGNRANKTIPLAVLKQKIAQAKSAQVTKNTQNALRSGPHVEKVYVRSGQTYLFVGDTHGSAHSLMRLLYRWKKMGYIDENLHLTHNTSICFLGDLADRGAYGAEVWYIALSLFVQNPGRVFIIRGNHEERLIAQRYGFEGELIHKYKGDGSSLFNKFCSLWDTLPSAIYFLDKNGDGVQACHGGVPLLYRELGKQAQFDRMRFLQNFLQNKNCLARSVNQSMATGLSWSDFTSGAAPGRGRRGAGECEIGARLIPSLFKNTGVKSIFRGHGHNGYAVSTYGARGRRGFAHKQKILVKDAPLYVFMSCPEGQGRKNILRRQEGYCNVDGFGVLSIRGERFDKWVLVPYEYDLSQKNRDGKLVRVADTEGADEDITFAWV